MLCEKNLNSILGSVVLTQKYKYRPVFNALNKKQIIMYYK